MLQLQISVWRNGTNDIASVSWSMIGSGEFADYLTVDDVAPFSGAITLAAGM